MEIGVVLTLVLLGLVLFNLIVLTFILFLLLNAVKELKSFQQSQPQVIKIETAGKEDAEKQGGGKKEFSEPFVDDIPQFKNKKVEDIKIEKSFNGRLGKVD